jgi:hypothetical protein
MARPKVISDGAKRTTIYLNPAEDLALSVIENSRRVRVEKRCQPSEIIADALWFYLEHIEGKIRKEIEALLPTSSDGKRRSNLKQFPETKGGAP